MKRTKLYFAGLICLAFTFSFSSAQAQNKPEQKRNPASRAYLQLYDQLTHLKADPDKVAHVNNLSFHRDVAQFYLEEGDIYLMASVGHRVGAALFLGKGHLKFIPPTKIEREQLARFYKSEVLDKKIKSLFIIFADSTLQEFEQNLTFSGAKVPRQVNSSAKDALEYLYENRGKIFRPEIMQTILEDKTNGLFYAHVGLQQNSPIMFELNPFASEEISLMQRTRSLYLKKIPDLVCQFHKQEDYHTGRNLQEEDKDAVRITKYKIESTIPANLDFSARAEIEFESLKNNTNWLFFNLFSEMVLDSAFWSNGKRVAFFKHKDNPAFYIQCPQPLKSGDMKKFKMYYHGDLLDIDENNWVNIKAPSGWYPVSGIRNPAVFDLTFKTDKKYTLVSIGKNVSAQNEEKSVVSRWVSSRPIRNASFNVGVFEKFQIDLDSLPPVTVYMSKYGHGDISRRLARYGISTGKNMNKQVGADVTNSLAFFRKIYGEPFVKHFYATEIPYLHGEAFPGMIHLSWATFINTGDYGYDEIFRAHEVAHQWWGIGVDFKSYHDQWLSEGFAEFSGLYYMQNVLRDNKKYFNVLEKWKREIFQNRKYIFGSGQEAGPVWLGYRTSSSKTPGDYDLIIYKKGAWVLHMLRNLLMNPQTLKEKYFNSMMRDFYTSFRGKRASTDDFQKIVEKYAGVDMDWFFRQWIYDTDLPEYCLSYKTNKSADGKYHVKCKVEQKGVSENFQMYMPFRINFRGDRFARLRYLIKGPVTVIDLPPLPSKPKKIILNEFESVLCDVKYEKWKEN